MGDLYAIALYAVGVLAVVVVVLSAHAVLARWRADRQRSRASRLRPRIRAAVDGYLDGRVPLEVAERALASGRRLGIGVLLEVASTRPREQQVRLRPLAGRDGFEQQQLHALTHRATAVRARAAVHLGYLGSDAAAPGLQAALRDEQLDVRLAAAQALVQMRRADAVMPILQSLALPGRWPQQRATELLYGLDALAIAPLRQVLADRRGTLPPAMLAVAINVLGMLGERGAAAEVAAWLDHDDTEVRVAAAKALGAMDEPGVAAGLARTLRDPAWEVRSMAAKSLGKLREALVIPALEHALTDPAWWVRCNAAEALAELGAGGIATLKRVAATQADPFARDISRQLLQERNLVPALVLAQPALEAPP